MDTKTKEEQTMTDKPSILIIQYGNLIRIDISFSAAIADTEERTGGCQKNDSLVRTVRSIESSTVFSFQIRLDRRTCTNKVSLMTRIAQGAERGATRTTNDRSCLCSLPPGHYTIIIRYSSAVSRTFVTVANC